MGKTKRDSWAGFTFHVTLKDDVALVSTGNHFCNACDKLYDGNMGGCSGEFSAGVMLNDEETEPITAVMLCECGNVFVMQDGVKRDIYNLGERKRVNTEDMIIK